MLLYSNVVISLCCLRKLLVAFAQYCCTLLYTAMKHSKLIKFRFTTRVIIYQYTILSYQHFILNMLLDLLVYLTEKFMWLQIQRTFSFIRSKLITVQIKSRVMFPRFIFNLKKNCKAVIGSSILMIDNQSWLLNRWMKISLAHVWICNCNKNVISLLLAIFLINIYIFKYIKIKIHNNYLGMHLWRKRLCFLRLYITKKHISKIDLLF